MTSAAMNWFDSDGAANALEISLTRLRSDTEDGRAGPIGGVVASSPCCPRLTRLLVVLDESQTGNAKSAGTLRCFFNQLLVGETIERTDVTDLTTIDEAGARRRRWHPCQKTVRPR